MHDVCMYAESLSCTCMMNLALISKNSPDALCSTPAYTEENMAISRLSMTTGPSRRKKMNIMTAIQLCAHRTCPLL